MIVTGVHLPVEVLWDEKKYLQGPGASTSLKLIASLLNLCFGQDNGKLNSVLWKSYGMRRKICRELELPLLSS